MAREKLEGLIRNVDFFEKKYRRFIYPHYYERNQKYDSSGFVLSISELTGDLVKDGEGKITVEGGSSLSSQVSIYYDNKNIIVIDDITTTGATFKEAKRVLHLAGVKTILCISVAH